MEIIFTVAGQSPEGECMLLQKNRGKRCDACLDVELLTGFEPVTSSLPRMCATYCATTAYFA